jgi:hypothetical protein
MMETCEHVAQVCALLGEQQELLWRIHHAATDPPGKVTARADLENFFLWHGLHIREMAKNALVLMRNREPYGVALLARSALEGAFNLVAAKKDSQFGPQRMAFEREDLARKLKLLAKANGWPNSRHPKPDDCLRDAERIRRDYHAPSPTNQADRNRIEKIEEIARVAKMSPYYDHDYRQLCLPVHANQAGILNAASGFLVQKAMLALCSAALLASATLCDKFRLRAKFDHELQDHNTRLAQLMQQPDYLLQAHNIFGNSTGPNPSKRPQI